MAGRKLHVVFFYLEKTFNRALKELVRRALRRKDVMKKEVSAITKILKHLREY